MGEGRGEGRQPRTSPTCTRERKLIAARHSHPWITNRTPSPSALGEGRGEGRQPRTSPTCTRKRKLTAAHPHPWITNQTPSPSAVGEGRGEGRQPRTSPTCTRKRKLTAAQATLHPGSPTGLPLPPQWERAGVREAAAHVPMHTIPDSPTFPLLPGRETVALFPPSPLSCADTPPARSHTHANHPIRHRSPRYRRHGLHAHARTCARPVAADVPAISRALRPRSGDGQGSPQSSRPPATPV